jgi:hypothetical protein
LLQILLCRWLGLGSGLRFRPNNSNNRPGDATQDDWALLWWQMAMILVDATSAFLLTQNSSVDVSAHKSFPFLYVAL